MIFFFFFFPQRSRSSRTWPRCSWSELRRRWHICYTAPSDGCTWRKLKFVTKNKKYFFCVVLPLILLCTVGVRGQQTPCLWIVCPCFTAYIHAPFVLEGHLFYLLHSEQLLLCLPQLQISAIRVIIAHRRWYKASSTPPTPTFISHWSGLERHLIHADHCNLRRLEGWIWGTHACFTVSLIEPCRLRGRGSWVLMVGAPVASDGLMALAVLKMGPWCHYWRSDWVRIADIIRLPSFIQVRHLLTMHWGLANLSAEAWPLIKSQITTLLPYVG